MDVVIENRNHLTNAQPTVLLISTTPSFSPARLAMALARTGFELVAICPKRHPLCQTRSVRKVFLYRCLTPMRSIKKAIQIAKPDLLVPCDDWAACLLHQLYQRETSKAGQLSVLARLIEHSLGSPQNFQLAYERATLLKIAQEQGIRVPRIQALSSLKDIRGWARDVGFPAVLKADSTSGGEGVRIVKTSSEAEHAFRSLEAPPLLAKAIKRVLFDQDMALLWPSLLRKRYTVNIQTFVSGRDATSAVVCWYGQVLASLHFEVLKKQDAKGPSTVLRVVENQEMSQAVEKMARRMNLSGFHGFDFILETGNGHAHLIEMNPRATQVGHLALGAGHDLAAALIATITGREIAAAKATEKDTIVLFPQELLNDPASEYLQSGYHDVPSEDPEFVSACLKRVQKRRSSNWIPAWLKNLQKFSSSSEQ